MKLQSFKYHSKKDLGDDPIVMMVTESMIQQFAEDNFERLLTDIELNRVSTIFFEHDQELCDLMYQSINDALDEDCDWSYTDKDFAERQANKNQSEEDHE